MTAKELVAKFYESDPFRNYEYIEKSVHDDLEFHWHSSKGFLKMGKNDLLEFAKEMNRSYSSSRAEISHILEEGNTVTVRYAYIVSPIETPKEEQIMAYVVVIWEVNNGKLYRGYQMTQLG